MSNIDYKNKYQDLKLKFMNSVDLAFRLGYEAGAKDAQMESMQQQQAQAAANAQQNANQPGQPGQDEGQQDNQQDVSAHPEGSELDQHIAQLESMLGKSEIDPLELKKAVNDLKQLQELKKSTEAIKSISKALHRPEFKVSQNANHNLNSSAKKALSAQEEIVTGIFKAWSEEETKATKDINAILSVEGLLKKD